MSFQQRLVPGEERSECGGPPSGFRAADLCRSDQSPVAEKCDYSEICLCQSCLCDANYRDESSVYRLRSAEGALESTNKEADEDVGPEVGDLLEMKELICDVNGASSSEGLDLHGEGSSRHVLCGTEDGINEKRSALAAPDFQELVNRSQGLVFWSHIKDTIGQKVTLDDARVLRSLCFSENVKVTTTASSSRSVSSCGSRWVNSIPVAVIKSYSSLFAAISGSITKEFLKYDDEYLIQRDVQRTVGSSFRARDFHAKNLSEQRGSVDALYRILAAATAVDGMGYCQGMNYVADFLLNVLRDENVTFCVFLYALRNLHIGSLYESKLPILSDFLEVFELQLLYHCPDLAIYLRKKGFLVPYYALEWFTTLFTLSSPFPLTLRVWDLLFAGFKDALFRCSLAMMMTLKEALMSKSAEELLIGFRELCFGVDARIVISTAMQLYLYPIRYKIPESPKMETSPKPVLRGRLGYSSMMQHLKLRSAQSIAKWRSGYSDGGTGERCLLFLRCRYVRRTMNCSSETGRNYLVPMAFPAHSMSSQGIMREWSQRMDSSFDELEDAIRTCGRLKGWESLLMSWLRLSLHFTRPVQRVVAADYFLRFSISCGAHVRAVSFIIAVAGGDPNSMDRWLTTPLHLAARFNRPDVARLLILCGADVSILGGLNLNIYAAETGCSPGDAFGNAQTSLFRSIHGIHSIDRFGESSNDLQPFLINPESVACLYQFLHSPGTNAASTSAFSAFAVLNVLRGKICIICNTATPVSRCPFCGRYLCCSCLQSDHQCSVLNVKVELDSLCQVPRTRVHSEDCRKVDQALVAPLCDSPKRQLMHNKDDLDLEHLMRSHKELHSTLIPQIIGKPFPAKTDKRARVSGIEDFRAFALSFLRDMHIEDLISIRYPAEIIGVIDTLIGTESKRDQKLKLENYIDIGFAECATPFLHLLTRDCAMLSFVTSADANSGIPQVQIDQSPPSAFNLWQVNVAHYFLRGQWKLIENDALWMPDESAWVCAESSCSCVFSIFLRKHHCRRCGFIFCKEHVRGANVLTECTPDDLKSHLAHVAAVHAIDIKEVLMCSSCVTEMRFGPNILYSYCRAAIFDQQYWIGLLS